MFAYQQLRDIIVHVSDSALYYIRTEMCSAAVQIDWSCTESLILAFAVNSSPARWKRLAHAKKKEQKKE
jgi:hypothetical protein